MIPSKNRMSKHDLEEWRRTSTTATPSVVFYDEADLSVTNDINHESSDVHLDQSNHGFSFINLHWASFSTGLSSVLAPPPTVVARSPDSPLLTPGTSSPTRTRAPLRSFPPLPRLLSIFPRRGPPASTPSTASSRTLTPVHSVKAYNAAAAFSSAPRGSVSNLKVHF